MDHVVFEMVAQAVRAILSERGDPVPVLNPETPIYVSGLDSLDIAALTIQLNEQIGRVPEEKLRQYPKTLGQLAELYGRYQESPQTSEALKS